MLALDPITHEYDLGCSAEQAFATYTERISEWWDPRYTANPETLQAVTIEPCIGGRVYATHHDIGEHVWGEVKVWEPERRLVHTFTLAQDPEHPSEVAVEFVPGERGCTMLLAHGGWTEASAAVRDKFGDWPVMLDRFCCAHRIERLKRSRTIESKGPLGRPYPLVAASDSSVRDLFRFQAAITGEESAASTPRSSAR